jgi:hypothetical protein
VVVAKFSSASPSSRAAWVALLSCYFRTDLAFRVIHSLSMISN